MIPERGTPKNTFSTFPTREFRFILDSRYLKTITSITFLPVLELIKELKLHYPKIDIQIYLQTHLCSEENIIQADIAGLEFFEIPKIINEPSLVLNESLKKSLNKVEYDSNAIDLLSISDIWQSDGIITDNSLLTGLRYQIYQYHRIKIIPLNELADIVEIISHGNSIYRSTTSRERRLNFGLYYQLTHWKASRYFNWCLLILRKITEIELVDNLRTALVNRYPYILYSRDMIRFYELQSDYYSRRGLYESFGLAIGFYVNTYAFLLWGMLDQLTVIAKYKTELKLDEKDCGIRKKSFGKFSAIMNLN